MNILRLIISVGICVTGTLEWLSIGDLPMSILFPVGYVVTFIGTIAVTHAIYNISNASNVNTWIPSIVGLVILAFCFYFFTLVRNYTMLMNYAGFEVLAGYLAPGFYLATLLGFLLFLTGFDKAHGRLHPSGNESRSSHSDYPEKKKQDSTPNTSISEWLEKNPGRSLNDFFAQNRK